MSEPRDPALFARLTARIAVDANGCWIWQASKRTDGYGQINFNGRPVSTHRVMWLAMHGEWFKKMQKQFILHTCDVRPCINPEHLWKGTPQDNVLDCDKKGRNPNHGKTHCKRGHPFDARNSRQRVCLTCRRLLKNAWLERKRIRLGTKRRPPVITEATRQEALRLVSEGKLQFEVIAKDLNISTAQLYRARKKAGL